MPNPDLETLDLADAARLTASKQVSPLELTEAYIARIEALDGRLNAFLTRTFDAAMQSAKTRRQRSRQAAIADRCTACRSRSRTSTRRPACARPAGSPIRDTYVPDEDAFVVSKLKRGGRRAAGQAQHARVGVGRHEHQRPSTHRRTTPGTSSASPGGSSGGSGVAIAAALCLRRRWASDTRGSIRIPASLCGITVSSRRTGV